MKIAIHNDPESFSSRWIKYCNENNIPYKLVNCYDSDIVKQLDDVDGLMWHWNQNDYKAALFARQLTLSLEKKGIKIFPDVNTSWHHDDKLGQKYLLESIGAPLVQSYVFYTKKEALQWLNETTFPKVFKLRGGAGSINVSLVKTKKRAKQLINRAFGTGFSHIDRYSRLKDRFWALRRDKNKKALRGVFSGIARLFLPTEVEKFSHNEKGYIYFQDFIPKNEYDTRLVVIGSRCIGVRRYCRTGDFRASGSGIKAYDPELFDHKCIRLAFDITKKLKSQSVAFDFIWDNGTPKIVEISYCFIIGPFYDDCPGYWDADLRWHAKPVNPQYFMIEDFIEELKYKDKNITGVHSQEKAS
ncbi:MAG TPA: hypothetical protein VG847_13730 [Chitinophagaceae bacterium]|nr:hypothetical protein [Chitinophagaceae bacterium]